MSKEKNLLRFVTCGNVDDGKSTLIGHLLYDAKLIFADQAQTLALESAARSGSDENVLDYSLLLDGLAAEREQGITIDVAYRYFTTDKRSFIVADCPGHEEYTRNMAVGAGTSDLAVILLDITKGLTLQTKRHLRICSLVGIRHFVFAVNKMDTVGYREEPFLEVKEQIEDLCTAYPVLSLAVIPTSATEGDNVVHSSTSMPWYDGPSLLCFLEEADTGTHVRERGFTMPVQRVCRTGTFRGYEGTIASGSVAIGDEVRVLPSGTGATVTGILSAGRACQSAGTGEAVTLSLSNELDISRGNVLEQNSGAECSSFFSVTMLWMDDVPLVAGKNYFFQLGTNSVPGIVYEITHRIDASTGEKIHVDRVEKNEICTCKVSLSEKIAYEVFSENRVLGSMILIDRITNATSAAAIIEHKLSRSDNLTYQKTDITRSLREEALGQKAKTLWFTGLSGTGKSTLANEVEKRLHAMGKHCMLLDGDNIRLGLNRNLGFTEKDRIENIRRIAEVAKLMNDAGLIVLTAFISPFTADRRNAREIIGPENFLEIYVSTPLSTCEERDVKGLYKKARSGEIRNFTGVSSPYEPPEHPSIETDTSLESLDNATERIIALLFSGEE